MHPLFAAAGVALAVSFPLAASAQAPVAALSGLVSSTEEAAMEGVLVNATRAGSNRCHRAPGAEAMWNPL
jgi:virginiamycin B lyase